MIDFDHDLSKKALEVFGFENREIKLMEEMAELQVALFHHAHEKIPTAKLKEELIDVYNLLQQLIIHYFANEDEVEWLREKKYLELKKAIWRELKSEENPFS